VIPASKSSSQRVADGSIGIVFAYYENPTMLALQWKTMAEYSSELKEHLEVIVVDDGSPQFPASEVERPRDLPKHSLFRIDYDIRWNQDAARNIGAHEATSNFLLVTDIDHLVPAAMLETLLRFSGDEAKFYTFPRIKFDDGTAREPHPNSYFMTRALYWRIGGHDEDFAGIYGKDYLFRKRAQRLSGEVEIENCFLARVGPATVGDAGTMTITRHNTLKQRMWGYVLELLKSLGLWRGVQTLTHPYTRVV
jgi:hypothetical protein